MNERRQDYEWLSGFARRGDQPAFGALVRRHLDLVYATALRKVADPGAAEEVAQNVFATLARKAWRFAPDDSLPAWLYRTTLLEAKSWWRGELRRRRRERAAAELGATMKTPNDQPALGALVPLLDEALLCLGEKDRAALLLRYYESRSLREVGAALGVSEDTAQKRVTTAIERVAKFFQRRGFRTATVAATTAALQHTSVAAPSFVATSVLQAASQAAPPALAALTGLLARVVCLTKVEKAAVCLVLIAAPALWHWQQARAATDRAVREGAQLQTAVQTVVAPAEQPPDNLPTPRPATSPPPRPEPAGAKPPPRPTPRPAEEGEVRVRGLVELSDFTAALLYIHHHSLDRSNALPFVIRQVLTPGQTYEDRSIRDAYVQIEIVELNIGSGQVSLRLNGLDALRELENWGQLRDRFLPPRPAILLPDAGLDDFLELYAALTGRTVLCHPEVRRGIKETTLSIVAPARDRAAAATVFERTCRDRGFQIIPACDRFALLVPASLANAISASLRQRPPPGPAGEDLIAQGLIHFKNVDLTQVVAIYGELIGRKLSPAVRLPGTTFSFRNQTVLSRTEVIYALDTLFAWQGLRVVLVGEKQFNVVPVSSRP